MSSSYGFDTEICQCSHKRWQHNRNRFGIGAEKCCDCECKWFTPVTCDGCRWESAKHHEIQLNSSYAFQATMFMSVPTKALFGPRPEHVCGKPDLNTIVYAAETALRHYRLIQAGVMTGSERDQHSVVKHWVTVALKEMELQ